MTPPLRPGDRVAVVAPAGPVDPARLETGLAVLRGWGLEVTVGEHVLDRHPKLDYLAGTDTDRAADLQRAWCDAEVRAVFCARGGYGCLRMIDLLDWTALADVPPKVFAGSSDITVLHEAFARQMDVPTLHTPMIAGGVFDEVAQAHLYDTLFHPERVRVISGPRVATLEHGVAQGKTVGGNLTLLASSVGAVPPPPDGAIVLLEDVNEEPYRLDERITQLLRAGYFTGVSGIALGSFTGCGEDAAVYAVIADLLAGLGIPAVWNLGFGHCDGALTVPLNVEATLNADEGTLTVAEPSSSVG